MSPERDFIQSLLNNENTNAHMQKSMIKIISLTSRTG